MKNHESVRKVAELTIKHCNHELCLAQFVPIESNTDSAHTVLHPVHMRWPALCWDLGGIQMRYRVIMNKLIFIWHLDNLEDSALAKQVFEIQKSQYLPGLVQECTEWIRKLNLPNLLKLKITKPRWKVLVKAAIKKENEDDLRTKMMSLEKLNRSELMKEKCEVKDYVRQLSAHDARTIFLKRTSMTRYVKMNYMHDIEYMKDM